MYDTFFSVTIFISLYRAEGSKPAAVQPVQGGGRGGDLLLRLPAARPHFPLTQVNISSFFLQQNPSPSQPARFTE